MEPKKRTNLFDLLEQMSDLDNRFESMNMTSAKEMAGKAELRMGHVSEEDAMLPRYFKMTQEYQKQSLALLKAIDKNTEGLFGVIELINQNNTQQQEIIDLLLEILLIARATDGVDADSKYRNVMGKITDIVSDVETLQKLASFAGTTYSMVKVLLNI